jgi:hypothetical protein
MSVFIWYFYGVNHWGCNNVYKYYIFIKDAFNADSQEKFNVENWHKT